MFCGDFSQGMDAGSDGRLEIYAHSTDKTDGLYVFARRLSLVTIPEFACSVQLSPGRMIHSHPPPLTRKTQGPLTLSEAT